MIEQQVAERFRAAVDDEPPLELDPDELVDRLLRRTRRRQGLATALGVTVVATAAVGGAALLGGTGQRPAAEPTVPASTTPTSVDVRISATVPTGTREVLTARRQAGVRAVSEFLVDAVPTDQGTLEIRRDDEVLFTSQLARLDTYRFRPKLPVHLKPGQRVVVAVSCRLSRGDGCRVDVTYPAPVMAR